VLGLAPVLVLGQWPGGAITGRDRDLVARLTRAGIQRFDADGHVGVEHGDGHHDAVVAPAPHALPAVTVPTAGPQDPPGAAVVPALRLAAAPPIASRLPIACAAAPAVVTPPHRFPPGRAPPRA
jgi:hypothetical protein